MTAHGKSIQMPTSNDSQASILELRAAALYARAAILEGNTSRLRTYYDEHPDAFEKEADRRNFAFMLSHLESIRGEARALAEQAGALRATPDSPPPPSDLSYCPHDYDVRGCYDRREWEAERYDDPHTPWYLRQYP